MNLEVAAAQLNPMLGDLLANVEKIVAVARSAHAAGEHLLLTPELSICGSDPQDLLLRPEFVAACEAALADVAHRTADLSGLSIVIGHPAKTADAGALPLNAVSIVHQGAVLQVASKRMLSLEEQRRFAAGPGPGVAEVAGVTVGVGLAADADRAEGLRSLRTRGALALAVLDASAYHTDQPAERSAWLSGCASKAGLPLVYCNQLGGADGAVFDGQVLAFDAAGMLAARSAAWEEGLSRLSLDLQGRPAGWRGALLPAADADAELWHALVLGLRDYVRKSGFRDVALGLSGGIDSALVLVLAVDALGPQRVRALIMPSPYTADMSGEDARLLARRTGVRTDEIPIGSAFAAFKHALQPVFEGKPEDTTEENLQARIRGALLMALSNKHGCMVLATGNKSEAAVGYSTLYGDTCGGYAPICDVLKTTVYRLARWRNANDPLGRCRAPIPERIILRPPSAELSPGQLDQDSLPPYDVLDGIVRAYMEEGVAAAELPERGFAATDVARVLHLLRTSQYKRAQEPLGTRVSRRSFTAEWRYPIVHSFQAP